MSYDFKDKKVLVFGLGLLGGGVATTNWFIGQGAKVTVSDTKTAKELAPSLKKIKRFQGLTLKFELGRQTKKQIKQNEIIVVNPGVPISHPLIKYAIRSGKIVDNEATLFFKYFGHPIVAVTGTRGKTTTTAWTNHFLGAVFRTSVVGNSTDKPFLQVINRRDKLDIVALELPSFQLELFKSIVVAPRIAVVTNLYIDHLNWHGTFERYAKAKAAIFKHQQPGQILILNADNSGTKLFLKQKPKGHVWFFSKKSLTKNQNGLFYQDNAAFYQFEGRAHAVLRLGNFVKEYGEHNLENLLAASLAAFLAGVPGDVIQKRIVTLPQVPFRQEVIYKKRGLMIINDTTATSPEGGIAALKRFGGKNTILITGGTDPVPIYSADFRKRGGIGTGQAVGLDYKGWAKELPKHIEPKNVIFLSGSATTKMLEASNTKMPIVVDKLGGCLKIALQMASKKPKSVILFSPSSKSFEKFKNEYDRGKQFNKLVKKLVK